MTGVCHDRIELRDSVDDDKTDPDEAWRMLVADSWNALVMVFARQNRDRRTKVNGCRQLASIEPTTRHHPQQGQLRLLAGGEGGRAD
jgi:hypothetical protein